MFARYFAVNTFYTPTSLCCVVDRRRHLLLIVEWSLYERKMKLKQLSCLIHIQLVCAQCFALLTTQHTTQQFTF